MVFAETLRKSAPAADLTAAAPRPAPVDPPTSPEHDAFLSWLLGEMAIDGSAYRTETLRRRLPACLRALRSAKTEDARALLGRHPSLFRSALSAVLIGATSFFRDGPVFAALRDDVLPELVRLDRRPALRVWSAGCSDGAELYGVAILLAEMGVLHDCVLVGSDCRRDAVARAAIGAYDVLAMKEVTPELRARYFRREERSWRVVEALSSAVTWRTANVLERPEAGPWDLILCRNLAMYLRDEAVAPLWRALESALRGGGVLVVGKAERPNEASRLVPIGPCLYRRRSL